MKIGYFGIEGSYTYFAAKKFFGDEMDLIGFKTFKDVFEQLTSDGCAKCIIPIENSLGGSVLENYDNLLRYEVQITQETYLPIRHCLLGTGEDVHALKKVYGHPQALVQCTEFFQNNPTIEQVPYGDNASAAKFVSEQNDPSLGALASEETGNLYGLHVMRRDISDQKENVTRFLVLESGRVSLNSATLQKGYKVSLVFTLSHTKGSLVHAFEGLARLGMNLTKIESRPIQGKPFEYRFYVDMIFDSGQLSDIELDSLFLTYTVLGIYPIDPLV